MLGGLFYLRHEKIETNLGKMVLDPKNTGKDITDDVRDWNLFFVFGLFTVFCYVRPFMGACVIYNSVTYDHSWVHASYTILFWPAQL